jgi:c(7)-type cytochrome triheme protein
VRPDGVDVPSVRGEERLHTACGTCHDGGRAFSVDDDCDLCHVE